MRFDMNNLLKPGSLIGRCDHPGRCRSDQCFNVKIIWVREGQLVASAGFPHFFGLSAQTQDSGRFGWKPTLRQKCPSVVIALSPTGRSLRLNRFLGAWCSAFVSSEPNWEDLNLV